MHINFIRPTGCKIVMATSDLNHHSEFFMDFNELFDRDRQVKLLIDRYIKPSRTVSIA